MKRLVKIIPLLIFCCCTACEIIGQDNPVIIIDPINEETDTLKMLLNTGLTLLCIETVDGEQPTCVYVSPPYGSIGRGISNANKVPGRMIILKNNDTLYDSGDFNENESGLTIKIRGNSSAYPEKKPYKLSLQKKADLLFRGDSKYEDKSWLLIKDSESLTLKNEMSLKPLIGNKFAELIGMEWYASGTYVNLILNGKYQGIYYLTENVKRNEKCRVNVAKGKGYIFEYDPYWWNDEVYFDTRVTSCSSRFTIKEPDKKDISEDQIQYLRAFLLDIEESLINNIIPEGIDLNSFVLWELAQDILGSDDDGGINKFLTKYDNSDETRVKMGPLWDFDGIMKVYNEFPGIHLKFYYEYLWNNSTFIQAYAKEWEDKKNAIDALISYLYDFEKSNEAQSIDLSRVYEHSRWGSDYKTVADNIKEASDYFTERKSWLQHKVDSLTSNKTNVIAPLGNYSD